MRMTLLLLATTSLAACSGGGPTTVSGSATTSSTTTGTTGSTGSTTPTSGHTFVNPTEAKTYSSIGGVQRFSYATDENRSGQYAQIYAGDATTARNSGTTITYNPRDAIFDIVINQPLANVAQTWRFQDPAHRTDFGGAVNPQDGTPNIAGKGIQFLQAGGGSGTIAYDPAQSTTFPVGTAGASRNVATFFYQKPGTTTNYVTFAGFVRNATNVTEVAIPNSTVTYLRQDNQLERGAFVYGERSDVASVPKTGSATFNGDMIATMVYNPLIDTQPDAPTYFQWISGTSSAVFDFAASKFNLTLAGTVYDPQYDVFTSRTHILNAGATFNAAGSGRIDLVSAGGFLGSINSAYFTQAGTRYDVAIAGSSVDGAFFGPGAVEAGGGFRIVGGTPDERIDILGAFTGKKQ
jgi:hypothetical protein